MISRRNIRVLISSLLQTPVFVIYSYLYRLYDFKMLLLVSMILFSSFITYFITYQNIKLSYPFFYFGSVLSNKGKLKNLNESILMNMLGSVAGMLILLLIIHFTYNSKYNELLISYQALQKNEFVVRTTIGFCSTSIISSLILNLAIIHCDKKVAFSFFCMIIATAITVIVYTLSLPYLNGSIYIPQAFVDAILFGGGSWLSFILSLVCFIIGSYSVNLAIDVRRNSINNNR